MKKFALFVTLALGASLALSACGGGDSTINVALSDTALTPDTFTVPVGAQVTFNIKKQHYCRVRLRFQGPQHYNVVPFPILLGLNQIQAGTTKSGTFSAPSKATSFQMVCGVTPFDPVTVGIAKRRACHARRQVDFAARIKELLPS